MLKKILATSIFLVSINAWASDGIYCNAGTVKDIQSEQTNVVINISGLGWHQLGRYEELSFQSRLSMALSAQASGKKLVLVFPLESGVDCNQHNWNVSPLKVRISN
ncbi:exported hypothetical protein [Vibrio nigripulchritudo SO65]|uniref:hypothetical protein n=1 Tax=Vibrio TaxID=662 RepID=UPI0003B2393E|nr:MULTISPECIES: hypothetical protein [Vibrio]UAB71725.1 hypothetical protein INR79_07460 [Vibrio sp. SCSIO 43132]CCN36186.1 exported hypothetical protein [Vibrio nigripulchritudo AM115]CCN43519.1 exported hypothetical protein [Vibrio nigripulchritudo FTn2]CCN66059.1 exported hypothetical protein [Vibrio nigripulchritudo POn4]CCN78689.1 exported hypothetical protein [Vibrio nigripulchritudo SO65]